MKKCFNNLCTSKYDRLDMDGALKDEPLMKREDMERFFEVAKCTGVKYVHWSGLTRKENAEDDDMKKSKWSKLPSC